MHLTVYYGVKFLEGIIKTFVKQLLSICKKLFIK